MKIGEWDNLGRARGLLQHQVGDLRAAEDASHVTVNPDSGRMRILVATDLGLLDYQYMPAGSDPHGPWILRGQVVRWASVRGVRLQGDAQLDDATNETKAVWRLVAEEPKIELGANSEMGAGAIDALLDFARACLERAR